MTCVGKPAQSLLTLGPFNYPLSVLPTGLEYQLKVHETIFCGFMHVTELGIREGGMEGKETQFRVLEIAKASCSLRKGKPGPTHGQCTPCHQI